ncbi:tRNA (adenosine(37)-N6)-threonylcarbamoyltransferase complex dimerization subunit type 1 TsaB [Ancylobacter pratisalsi]|uniref:tRNA (Adenosine(37)-N6)-threonylcarbamoyltransferase complex dimerization subunit type 1 TsaB n=1 Tax=Ancylobacter pratisalsi TaxID=1745854 RepID=A0A6P1YMD0_9HYPH|nr:tRNA (adenosine(37)-N6)-threonylcarbamoyltransferase complex dimerization subunit type 1 TsaB [Ancylobacter pratisalsi]QIB33861.1 tRNA (adenosine(37)-N6)-threonylcarbamoyltransferase complex dimerization subunit type 1 TsaB [Ancylobacter pratisalsi]
MLILAIDTALEACAVAVHDMDIDSTLAIARVVMARGHAEALVPLVDEVMTESGRRFSDIDAFAVTVGPGSFTGLRVGLSAARGFGLATGKPVIGISTLAALAAPLLAEDDDIPVAAAVDARHGNIYLQMIGPGGRVLVGARAMALKDAARAVAIGPVRLAGSGAALLAAAWPSGERPPLRVDAEATPDPVWVARLASVSDPAKAPPRPLYLREADAKPQTAGRIARR